MANRKRPLLARCPVCDELYDPNGDQAKIHQHPEPQSGEFRDHWLASKLPYEQWLVETNAGRQWGIINA